MRIGFVTSEHTPVSSVAGPWDIFRLAASLVDVETNAPSKQSHGSDSKSTTARWTLDLLSDQSEAPRLAPLLMNPNAMYDDGIYYDLVVICALGNVTQSPTVLNPNTVSWLKKQAENGAKLASICTGAFLLAATGLLNRRLATTHWIAAERFRTAYPSVDLQIDRMVTQDGPFYCSGGAYAYQDLCMCLLYDLFGEKVADQCSRLLLIDAKPRQQSVFAGIQGLKLHQDTKILKIQHWMEIHVLDIASMDQIANNFHMSSRHFVRRFKAAVGEPPSNYLQRLRIELAKHLLKDASIAVEVVADKVGYQDVQYFRTLFKRFVGSNPSEYRRVEVLG